MYVRAVVVSSVTCVSPEVDHPSISHGHGYTWSIIEIQDNAIVGTVAEAVPPILYVFSPHVSHDPRNGLPIELPFPTGPIELPIPLASLFPTYLSPVAVTQG